MRLGKVDGAAAAFLEISAPFCRITRHENVSVWIVSEEVTERLDSDTRHRGGALS